MKIFNVMKTKIETQKKQILEHLQGGHVVTPMRALHNYGCYRLSARIYDLRKEGHKIKTEMIKGMANYSLN